MTSDKYQLKQDQIDIEFLSHKKYFVLRFHGDFGFPQIAEGFRLIQVHPAYQEDAVVLWDLRETTSLDRSLKESASLYKETKKYNAEHEERKAPVALLVSEPEEYQIVKNFFRNTSPSDRAFNVFLAIEAAENWLKNNLKSDLKNDS